MNRIKKQVKDGVLYGMGYICGKHNLHISKKERERIAKDFVNQIAKKPLQK